MSDNGREKYDLETPLVEASKLVRKLAEPCPAGDSLKAALYRAHRKLPEWTANRIRDVWNADPRVSIKAHEIGQLRKFNKSGAEAPEDTANEIRRVLERLETLTSTLAAFVEKTEREKRFVDRRKNDVTHVFSGVDNRALVR